MDKNRLKELSLRVEKDCVKLRLLLLTLSIWMLPKHRELKSCLFFLDGYCGIVHFHIIGYCSAPLGFIRHIAFLPSFEIFSFWVRGSLNSPLAQKVFDSYPLAFQLEIIRLLSPNMVLLTRITQYRIRMSALLLVFPLIFPNSLCILKGFIAMEFLGHYHWLGVDVEFVDTFLECIIYIDFAY